MFLVTMKKKLKLIYYFLFSGKYILSWIWCRIPDIMFIGMIRSMWWWWCSMNIFRWMTFWWFWEYNISTINWSRWIWMMMFFRGKWWYNLWMMKFLVRKWMTILFKYSTSNFQNKIYNENYWLFRFKFLCFISCIQIRIYK